MAEKLNWSDLDVDLEELVLRRVGSGQQIRDHWWNLRSHGTSAAVLAASRFSMLADIYEFESDEIIHADPETRDKLKNHIRRDILSRAYDAVVNVRNGEARVGFREDSRHLFGADYGEDTRWATIAPELGRFPTQVGIGLWVPEEKRWYGAQDIAVVEGSMPLDVLADEDRYPHTAVVSLA